MKSPWIQAMRLPTLPVSAAGVVAAIAMAIISGAPLRLLSALICLLFALLAQIASNFANEYFDFRAGLDAPGRVGPRRGVTEGDITPRAMLIATLATLGVACLAGLSLVNWSGWWLIIVGAVIALGVMAYSTGPYPLSRHALGEVAVIFFFGLIPVCFTYYLTTGLAPGAAVIAVGLGMGLMGADVLVVNNFRDRQADAAVGKTTIATLWPRPAILMLYLSGGLAGIALTLPGWLSLAPWWLIVPVAAAADHIRNFLLLGRNEGRALNPLLGRTALLMASLALALLLGSLTR